MRMMDCIYLMTVVILTVWSQLPPQTVGMPGGTGSPCKNDCRVGSQCPNGYVKSEGYCGSSDFVCCVECSDPWTMINGHCYLFSPAVNESKRNFIDARAICKSYSNSDLATAGYGGGHDQDPILAYLFEIYPAPGISHGFWLGARRTGPSTYEWVDGRSLPSTSHLWHYAEPDDWILEECVAVLPRLGCKYKRSYLFDVRCSGEGNFICELY